MRVRASPKNASPASIAIASPNFLCAVGLPRLKSSSSIAGRSSWTKEYVWMSSMAAADGSTRAGSDPKTQATSMQSVGRTRLPPASME
jgi:predicted secreted hydrolase